MAKLVVFSAFLLVALLALVADASFRTTITVVEEGDSQSQQQQPQRCQQQIEQRRQQLRQCQRFLSQASRYETDFIDQDGQGERQKQQQQHRQCCQGLESLDKQCRCEAVKQIVQQQQRGQEGGRRQGGEWQEEMVEKARYLPDSCNLEPRQCQVQSSYY